MIYSFVSILVLFGAALIIPIFSLKRIRIVPYIGITGAFLALIFSIATIPSVLAEKVISMQIGGWQAPFGITIVVDSLSMFLMMIISTIGFLAMLFSLHFIKERKTEFFSLTCFLLAGLLGVVQTGDIFNLFIFLELVGVSSYALVAFYRNKKAIEASIKYLIMSSLATSLILLGIAFLYGIAGTLNMADLAIKISQSNNNVLPVALGLIISGLSLKAGLVPFHTWVPDAHPTAPSPISAILSGLVIKAGIYSIARITFTVFGGPSMALNLLLILGVASMIVGAILALLQTSLKRMLAYSSISQMGYIAISFSLGTFAGISGGIFHIMNHAIIKSLLFLCSGIIIYQARTDDMHELGAFARFNPLVTYSFLIGIFALAGIPPLNGFASKWLIYMATLNINVALTIFAVLITALTIAYCLKAYYLIFLKNRNAKYQIRKIPFNMKFSIIVLVILCIILGILPQIGIQISNFVAQSFNNNLYINKVLP